MEKDRNPNPSEPKGKAPTRSVTPSRNPSFKNSRTGTQDFQGSNIKSDSCSCVQRRNRSADPVVYHNGGGQQIFQNSIINDVKVKSPTSSSSGSETTSSAIYCSTCGSFKNDGGGTQKFNGAVISIGRNHWSVR